MRQINPTSHYSYLHAGLMKFFPGDTTASRLKATIGLEVGTMFADDDFSEFAQLFPVRALFEWLMSGEGLCPYDLTDKDDVLYDDEDKIIAEYGSSKFSHTEHIAALGLWFINSEAMALGGGPYEYEGTNCQGFAELAVLNHKAECLLNAYQALCYANRLSQEVELTPDEKESIAKFDFSAYGKAGAVKKYSQLKEIEEWAREQYLSGNWPSANKAAHALKEEVMARARSINFRLSDENAQRTIAGWLRKKKSSV